MWNLVVFAVIGLLIGGTARLLYPDRRALQVLGTMLISIAGALVGGVFSWIWWSDIEGEFHTGNFTLAVLGAIVAVVAWAAVAYQRRLHR
jgi:uncharacterized membrane protein YeaQ/YmgE (transglycosylase-associated protein family)